ncbi:sigma-54-dependent Fis family transcriptional regulator [Oceanobacter kriegii]|uniref:sigma-54-dependent Fis family transcriptional regulator n=1 Tax=Oceanobacter kriegii TaxID=64972 RepID=UPI00040E9AB7|nr:sigma-54-dependent Fis family transcriptional regulator [Oceanobacter kriegii]
MTAFSTTLDHRRHTDQLLQFARSTRGMPEAADLIGRSWWRCLQDYGLEPGRQQPARILTQSALREHQDAADELLAVARAGVDQLYRSIQSLGYVLLLTDSRGITVQFHGRQDQHDVLRRAGLYLGSDWSEAYAGTCAVGTCIQEQAALTCHRGDHFDGAHIGLTCTAAPIFDPFGKLLAVLDISALNAPDVRASQTFALHLTQLYARMIEDAYFLRCYRRQLIFRADESRELVALNGRILLALDHNGDIVAANTAGRRLLDSRAFSISGASSAAGRQSSPSPMALADLLGCPLDDVLSINHDCPDGVRAFRIAQQTLYGSLIEPVQEQEPLRRSDLSERVAELDALAGDDAAMRKTLQQAKRFRNRQVSLLILGETGSGKDVLANAIHRSSERGKGPFIAVNCAAIPESLIESELFGYCPGAFTGGRSKGAKGLIQQAHGGTLFLDEIGDMPLALQTRLLRVLAEQQVTPLGADKPVTVDCRVIAATHQNLPERVANGSFRADLYYRLNGATLTLPPLRQRADREFLMRSLLNALKVRVRRPSLRLRADAVSALLAWHWPGNVRELVNVLGYAEANAETDVITVAQLPESIIRPQQAYSRLQQVEVPDAECSGLNDRSDADTMAGAIDTDPQARQLAQLLEQQQWNLSAVARQLNISRPTLYRRIRRFGIARQTCIQ